MTATGLPPAQAGHLIGNALTRSVVQRSLLDLLPRAGIVSTIHLRPLAL